MEDKIEIFKNILWSFNNDKFSQLEDFKTAIVNYNEKITGDTFSINLNQPILTSNKVVIQYEYWNEIINDSVEPDFYLTADNGEFFTIGELLFKIHNCVCEKLNEDDHHFFEGLELWTGANPNYPNIPMYFLQQGS